MDEFDIYAEWAFSDNISITPSFASAFRAPAHRVAAGTGGAFLSAWTFR
jgi:outer membrane cobalamin receptor